MERKPSRKTFRPRLDEMITSIRNNIITGNIEPGKFLPSEKQLAEQFGLSVPSVRKGLSVLANESLIVKKPKIGSQVVDPAEKGAITIRLGLTSTIPDDVNIHQLIVLFHRKHPNIRIQVVKLPGLTYDQAKSHLDGGMLDVLTMNYNHFRAFADAGRLDEIEPLARNEALYPFLSDAFTEDGELRVQPFVFSPIILCYNRSHFVQQGLQEPDSSWDWKRLFECAAALDIPDERIGFHCYFSTANRACLLLMQKGKAFERSEDGRLKLGGTEMMEAIRYSREIYKKIPSLPNSLMDWDNVKLDMFRQGKVSMMITSYFVLNFLHHSDLNYDIAPVPHFGEPLTILLAIGMAVNRQSKHKEAACKLVDFMISPTAQQYIREHTCSLPARVNSAEWSGPDTSNRPSRFTLFREIIPSFRLFTDLNIREDEYNLLFKELRLYWAGLINEETLSSRIESNSSMNVLEK
ncbi:extracellular solute-binding protein [Paenibacillus mesophilus]|uniref:extracellular solute-binding protein n=1 Tax=Paenibacillus mesophilus TaxID=2582849 RepID=UPI00110EBC68|nr:extracellular solute-binding protein [Paenibacillus mesophilus]TMV43753.1 extracellular solute-binding protein [Paenibacillus mesophilus]